ncbi:MAG: hypothetical protein ABI158_03330, partial [Edaphobacter sp.]
DLFPNGIFRSLFIYSPVLIIRNWADLIGNPLYPLFRFGYEAFKVDTGDETDFPALIWWSLH